MAKHERKTIDKVTSKMASVSNAVLAKHLEIDTARCDRKRKLSVGFTQFLKQGSSKSIIEKIFYENDTINLQGTY